jgi:hypothetical protein
MIAHVDVWREVLTHWLRAFIIASDDAETTPYCTLDCKPGLEPAYLYERILTAVVAATPGLEVMSIPGNATYTAVGDA